MSTLTPLDAAQTAAQEAQAAKEGWLHRILVAFDIFCNVTFFRGLEDETISSHSARACEEGKTWGIWMSAFLNFFQSDHGVKAQAGDEERAEEVSQVEDKSGGIV